MIAKLLVISVIVLAAMLNMAICVHAAEAQATASVLIFIPPSDSN